MSVSLAHLSHGVERHRRPQSNPRVSVVVPTLNEAKNLPAVFERLPEDVYEVIVVDGRSVDDTIEVAKSLRPDVKIVLQTRRGKGNALACGFAAVTGDVVIMLDADGSADPAEIPAFVDCLLTGADVAKGSRFLHGGGSSDLTAVRKLGNLALNGLVNVMYRTRYTDLCYGYNAFWADCIPVLRMLAENPPGHVDGVKLWGDGFEVETLITIRVSVAGLAIKEVPSYEADRIFGESNLSARTDGLRVLRTIVAERRSVRRLGRQVGTHSGHTIQPTHAKIVIDLTDVPHASADANVSDVSAA